MRYDLTETHIAGIAAGVLAIVIIAGAVALAMSVAPPSPNGNETDSFPSSPTVTSTPNTTTAAQPPLTVTAEPNPTEAPPTQTPPPTTTASTPTPKTPQTLQTTTATATATPTATAPPTETANQGIDVNKVSVEALCTNYETNKAEYQLQNGNTQPATIVYSSTDSPKTGSRVTIEGGSSVDVRIPLNGGSGSGSMDNSTELTVGFPGISNGSHSGVGHKNAKTPCNGQPAPSPSVTFTNQTTPDGRTVTIQQASLPEGGFIALYTTDDRFVTASGYISAGTANDVKLTIDQGIQGNVSLIAQLHYDNGDKTFGPNDAAYTGSNGAPVSDTATVESENGLI